MYNGRDNGKFAMPKILNTRTGNLIQLWLFVSLALLAGCANPISARRSSFHQAFKDANANILTSEHYSSSTRLVLRRFGLEDRFDKAPAETLQELHRRACQDNRRDLLFALAELSYAHGQKLARTRQLKPWVPKPAQDYFLCSAIYASIYLFGGADEHPPRAFEAQFGLACDLYNLALARAFIPEGNTNGVVKFGSQSWKLPPGTITVELSQPGFPWDLWDFETFRTADEFVVHGLTVRNQQGALGATLMAEPTFEHEFSDLPNFARQIPATLILKCPFRLAQWSVGAGKASLELYSGYESRDIDIAGQKVPLRTDTTTPLAYSLNSSFVWKLGRMQFFSSEQLIQSDVYQTQPYEAGRVPVVFVHGTFSSPVWWAEMANSLRADPVLSRRYQFWFYIYNSGNPILFTAADFRADLTNTVNRLDPEGKDPALRQMVVIGHSQGGLLTKLAVMDPGDAIWTAVSKRSWDEIKLNSAERAELERCIFFKPVPYVDRAVFISTPHRGSYLATAFVRNLAAKFMSLPGDVLRARKDLLRVFGPSQLPRELRSVPSSLSGMSPHNPALLKIASIPPDPDVTAHSIIAVKGKGDPARGNDGVVKYTSAHVPYVESELVVRSSHTCQDKPATIEEVRRILLRHLDAEAISKSPASIPGEHESLKK